MDKRLTDFDRPFDVNPQCCNCGEYGQKFPATARKLPDDYWTRAGAQKPDDGDNAKPATKGATQ